MTSAPVQQPAPPGALPDTAPAPRSPRLLSLDVFRGLVILAMLIVNNIGSGEVGYFWKHADWPEPWLAQSFRDWSLNPSFSDFPLFRHCTLADYVMPSFMLIIGLAIPFSAASQAKRGIAGWPKWWRVIKRSATLVLLGWILCYFRAQFAPSLYGTKPWAFSLGMDVLQLLGVSYLAARLLYELPPPARLAAAAALYLWHWSLLRFLPQGDLPAGTFTEHHNAVGYAYAHWPLFTSWLSFHLGPISMGWTGLLSVPPATATILLGSAAGDLLRNPSLTPRAKSRRLLLAGIICCAIGLAWAFDLPFNKPRWTPCYLLWVAGVDLILMSFLSKLLDQGSDRLRAWTYPLVVFGSNAIAVYFFSIFTKVLFLNTPRLTYDGHCTSPGNALIASLQHLTTPHIGGWLFTIAFVTFWWLVLDQMYRRKWIWKV